MLITRHLNSLLNKEVCYAIVEMAEEKPDEMISLEDLVSDQGNKSSIAGAPVPPTAQESSPTQPEASPPAGGEAKPAVQPASDDVDRLLSVEDPSFLAQMGDLAELSTVEEVEPDNEIEKIVAQAKVDARARGIKKLALLLVIKPTRKVRQGFQALGRLAKSAKTDGLPLLKLKLAAFFATIKSYLKAGIGVLGAGLAWVKELPRASKLMLVVVMLLGAGSIAVTALTLKGQLLPDLQRSFLVSFESVADRAFKIEEKDTWENFNDPLLHPEHIVLIERIIANLAREENGANPMALIDIYIEAGSHPGAVEIKDREGEARDVIGRTLEKMRYDDLVTVNGKNKLKVFLRKDLNAFMTQGRVRRIYFKSIILKP